MSSPNYKQIAMKIGDLIKYDSTVNIIDRSAQGLFKFQKENFPAESITSVRAQTVYNWIMSLAKQEMTSDDRDELLARFCHDVAGASNSQVEEILKQAGVNIDLPWRKNIREFENHNFHEEVVKHSRKLFLQGNYFHAIFEANKAFNKRTKEKAQSQKDGVDLMMTVWGWERGVLKITPCQTDTDKNVQEGMKFLSAGLMSAIRNPTAHEPEIEWPITKEECLELLSFLSFLFRKLDKSVFFQIS
jgi:uncharacterized protein (TIGR02391 family)